MHVSAYSRTVLGNLNETNINHQKSKQPCADFVKGYTEGTVIGEYGIELLVRLSNGKELAVYRDEVIIDD